MNFAKDRESLKQAIRFYDTLFEDQNVRASIEEESWNKWKYWFERQKKLFLKGDIRNDFFYQQLANLNDFFKTVPRVSLPRSTIKGTTIKDKTFQVDPKIIKLQKLSNTCETLNLDELKEIIEFSSTKSLKKWLLKEALDKISFRLDGELIIFDKSRVPMKQSNRLSFFCQIDSQNHPSTHSAYQCYSCNRFVCADCYENSVQVGISTCPFCDGELVRFQ